MMRVLAVVEGVSEELLLTQVAPWVFPSYKVRALAREVSHLGPEAINEGETSAPSKRLLRTFKHFRKTTHAVEAMEAIGLVRMRAQCHRSDAWVTRLESLGKDRP